MLAGLCWSAVIHCQECPLLEISHLYDGTIRTNRKDDLNVSHYSGRRARSWAQRARNRVAAKARRARSWAQRARNRVAAKARRAAEALDVLLLPPLIGIMLQYFSSG